eukprot:CAMPEP_0113314522 /NCGR_PEP_ID=MMETSP0010_2-20120614/10545_1 /TAXON_ID=216773 ORGANISM="Corethron hystrix, Strain 308" /NCGR_SAMPLE_ID=MMETSP0010_2 /ASSEMBLY_ACC=CAM_ASM_000155 /LENGTH=163 /DNA_ID=CAMNT_0000170817 /DNA_START=1133 /DNA_END=1624 /DNA_ORIENTATION=- /assembly_acc=CAM_ASM_000155
MTVRIDRLLIPPPLQNLGILDVPPVLATPLRLLLRLRPRVDVVVQVPHPPGRHGRVAPFVRRRQPEQPGLYVAGETGLELVDRHGRGGVAGDHHDEARAHAGVRQEPLDARGQVLDGDFLRGHAGVGGGYGELMIGGDVRRLQRGGGGCRRSERLRAALPVAV